MRGKIWWSSYGPFKRWSACPTRPDPVEVLVFYLEKRGIGPEERVSYLSELLDLQKSMAYNILKGEALDSISRCRQIVAALKIPPPLLGIDAKYYPIERHAYWWQAYGLSFHADTEGYPLMSEVIASLRMHRTHMEEGGRVKVWSQEDLGDATGLKKEAVYRMEHDENPLVLESMSRRAVVASALGTLAGENEPILFRLFGLDPQAYGVPIPTHESVPEVLFLPELLTDETLLGYQQQLAALFTEYDTCHAQNTVWEVHEWLRQLQGLIPQAKTSAQHVHLLALQCRYHELLVGIAREQCKTRAILFHAAQAIALAEQAMRLSDPKLGEQALLVTTNELLAAALLWRAGAFYELEQYESSQADIDRAFNLLPALQSNQLKVQIVADAGLIHAHTATSEMDRTLAFSYFSLAAQINTPNRFGKESNARDDNFIRCGTGMLSLRKAMALCAPNMKDATREQVRDLLGDAERLTDPELIRQHVIIQVFQARVYAAEGFYRQATEAALCALEKSRQIRSYLNRGRVEGLYKQLLNTSFRDKPRLAYLGMKLRTWDYEWEFPARASKKHCSG